MENEADNKDMHTAHEPIVCPVCGSKNLAFTEERRVSLGRLVRIGLVAIYILVIFLQLPSESTFLSFATSLSEIFNEGVLIFTAFWIIAFCATCLIVWNTERKSHAKGICRDCGHLWLLD